MPILELSQVPVDDARDATTHEQSNYNTHLPHYKIDGGLAVCERCHGGEADLISQTCDERLAAVAAPENDPPPIVDTPQYSEPTLSVTEDEKLADEYHFANCDPPPIVDDTPQAPSGPCTNCGDDSHWRPDCPEIAAEAHFRQRMRTASDEVASTALAKLHAESSYKLAKKQFELAVDSLNEIANRGPEHLPLFDGPASEEPQPDHEAVRRSIEDFVAGRSRPLQEFVDDPQAWRSAYIEVLGLPPKLADRLAEAGIANIGQLEDLRATGDMPGAGLRSIKGIGAAKVTAIEDAVLAWLTVHRDGGVFVSEQIEVPAVACKPGANGKLQAKSPSSPTPMNDRFVLGNAGEPDVADESNLPEGSTPAQLRARAAELQKYLVPQVATDSGAYRSGRDAFNRGDDLVDCPYTAGDAQDSWLKGWMYQNGMGRGATDQADDAAKTEKKKRGRKPKTSPAPEKSEVPA